MPVMNTDGEAISLEIIKDRSSNVNIGVLVVIAEQETRY